MQAGGLNPVAADFVDEQGDKSLAARNEYFSGAEIAGLVRSAASFALTRTLEGDESQEDEGGVRMDDLEKVLGEVRPASGKEDEVLRMRYPLGISACSPPMKRILRDLKRFTSLVVSEAPRFQSLLLVGAGGNSGAGDTALSLRSKSWSSSRRSVSVLIQEVVFSKVAVK